MRSSVISTTQVERVPGHRGPGDQRGHQEEGTRRELSRLPAGNGSPPGQPRTVKVHDFADKQLGKAAPYGVYDIAANTGWVNVGTDADTGAVRGGIDPPLVDHHRRHHLSRTRDRLLITADSGGSNGSRLRLWKTELAAFAAETGLDITVCHLPPGTSKWNKIEHRLFSAISRNWRGRPLESHEVVIETLRATTTSTGLTVQRRARHQHLRPRHQDHRQADHRPRSHPAAPPRVPRRLELHPDRRARR